ncbi:sucrase ferredoxin [Streptomyces sp. OF3]|uniref:Sucrase ferredoxin n=1 Tax=Streptomyces alkaliterrae TaxID=2213162 RepID=A0A7W3ZNP5_9ACTN|nr:sucrase ferredoxin [Streptomyces alkaliterrae]MBB1254667.1 sucrase ferredoxin [Streptomyces alkaliterrae]
MTTCTTASQELTEPLAATAATARTWLLVEQPGPWGSDALAQSRLDPSVGRALAGSTERTGTRVALVRRPGRHADTPGRATRPTVFVAHTAPGAGWLRVARPGSLRELLELDMVALADGDHQGFGLPYEAEPLVLVCTNGKRDRCCAVLGRPLATELAASHPAVWEVTHIGGHRFSPTLFVLPHGYAYGRADAPMVKNVLHALAEGRVVTDNCRGRSTWERPGQAAELAVRELTGECDPDALVVGDALAVSHAEPPEEGWAVPVRHRDGRAWRVNVVSDLTAPASPASCGAALGRQPRMAVTAVTALDAADG